MGDALVLNKFRLAFLIMVFIFFRGVVRGQYLDEDDIIGSGSSSSDERATTTNTDKNKIESRNESDPGTHMENELRPDLVGVDFSEYFIYSKNAEKYLASVRITDLLWPGNRREGQDAGDGLIMVGVKRPYYSISRSPYIMGKLDFSVGGSFFGVENRGLITISYNLSAQRTFRELSSSVSIEYFSFSIRIPF